MGTLIVYGTIEGQTGKIARFVVDMLKERGEDVQLYDTSERTTDVTFQGVDKVILAASVHERRHPKDFEVFLSAHHDKLEERKTMLLSVSLSAAFPEVMEDAQDYADELKLRTEFEPDAEMLVAGAVKPSSYDYYATQILQHVVLRGRDIDPTVQDREFTDWDALEEGVDDFLRAA